MSYRPPSSSGRAPVPARAPGTASRPPGTATRLTTGMAGARPGTRGGMTAGGVALQGAALQVADRPMTQQGLGGMKTGGKGPQRVVQDKTYFLGFLRNKMNELIAEIGRLQKEIDSGNEEQSSYLSYEKRAEHMAAELRDLQGQMADFNTLVDKINTDEDISDVQMDYEELKTKNDREEKSIDAVFSEKQDKESQIRQLETELDQERRMAENMVADMKPDMRQKYLQLKDMNTHLLKQLESGQQQLDNLSTKKSNLEEELSLSQIKQEAVSLYEKLHELEGKRDTLIEETKSRGTPAEEREALLKQVKEDNQEIANMERQTNELRERVSQLQEEVHQLDIDLEENTGERSQKYKELKKREETMDEFMTTFEESKAQEIERTAQLETNIVSILELTSRNMGRFQNLPTPKELATMQDDLAFKETEMKKSESTAFGLASESDKLQLDLQKVEQLESKITSEVDMLKEKIEMMTRELVNYNDLDKLREDGEKRKRKLGEDKVTLARRRDMFKKVTQQLAAQYEGLKGQLNENETYAQLGNLEKKWQHHEQNNFVMKEFIATKSMECDYRPISRKVSSMVGDYNQHLQEQSSKSSM